MGSLKPHGLHIDREVMPFEYISCTIFRGTDCDIDHYLVFAKVRERLAVIKN